MFDRDSSVMAPAELRPPGLWLRWLTIAVLNVVTGAWLQCLAQGQEEALPIILTNIQQIAATRPASFASNRYEAQFRGVVIYVSPPTRRVYVQDGEQGLQVNMSGPVGSFRAGQMVDIQGKILAGLPFPRVVSARAVVAGQGEMPEAKPSSAMRLAAGKDAFRWVSLRAMVRDMILDRGSLTLMLADQWRTYELVITGVASLPQEWIDAEIEVRGFGYPFYNARSQPASFRFHTPSMNYIRVIAPGVGNLFERPVKTIAEASRLPSEWKQRLKIAGTVTAHQPVDVLFVDDGTGPMQVNLLAPLTKLEGFQGLDHDAQVWLEPGDRVEVIGVRRNYSSLTPTLIQAEFRRIGKAPQITAQAVSIGDLQAGRFSGHLVSIAARLLDQRLWFVGNVQHQLLVLQAGDQIFQAAWESETPAAWDLKAGSYVRLTGVNDAMQGQFKGACIFQILLRSPADVVPAPAPAFWTRPEIRRIVLAVGAVGVLATGWILFQRWQMRRLEHRVADRTADLRSANEQLKEEVSARERAETEVQRALAQEKQLSELKSRFVSMVSHEFRTPLGIITSSAEILDAYLDRLSTEERKCNIRDITDATRHMSRMMEEVLLLGRVEAGKMTFRPTPLDLSVFGQRLVDEVTSSTNNRCPIKFTAEAGLPEASADEALLRHILTNLLNNAVKYSAPRSPVEFQVEARENMAVFTVADKGIGIPEADARLLFQAFHRGRNVGDTPGTGLGMTIVKRCVELHGGKIAFETHEGRGTAFIVALPLFGSNPTGNGEGTTQFIRAAAAGRELTFIL